MIILRQKNYGLLSLGGKLVSLAGKGIAAVGHKIAHFGVAHPIAAGLGLGYLAYRHYKNRKKDQNYNTEY